jgi:hypothetical protein
MSQKFLQKRALAYTRRTLSETSVTHLVVFLKYSDKISMSPTVPFAMYTTTLAAVRENPRAQIRPAKLSLPNLRFPGAPFFGGIYGGKGVA